ncbi:MAG: acetate--CoA ligase family protein [Pseudomonadota bacterium]
MSRLSPLIAPRSIAILGASADPGRVGGMPLQLLIQHGFQGEIYPINPKYSEISGLTCYPDVESLPGPVDLLAMAVAAKDVVPQLRRAAAKGVRSAVVFASGFAETGQEDGQRLQEELAACARDIGIPVAGPNCMGFANLDTHAYTAFASVFRVVEPPIEDRSVALITQSGNVCASVYAAGRKLGVGFNCVINTGNEADVEFAEYLEYFASDPGTRAVAGYVEGLRDGPRFRKVAAELRDAGRPLMLLKVGDTDKGAEAAASHTASLAGSQAVYRAAFEELNVMWAEDLSHLADLAYLSRFKDRTAGQRVAIITMSGALGALLADKLTQRGIAVPSLSPDVQKVLRGGIPDYGMVANPVDVTGNVVNQMGFFRNALTTLTKSGDVDFVLVYAPGYLLDRMAPDMIEVAQASPMLIAAIDTLEATCRDQLQDAGIPVFTDTARAVAALATFGQWHERPGMAGRTLPAGPLAASPPAQVRDALAEARAALTEVEGKALVASFGVPVVQERIAKTASEAAAAAEALGFPVVLKVLSPDIAHKSEAGGVRLGLDSGTAAADAFEEVLAAARRYAPDARIEGAVLQRQEASGVEVLAGITRDPVFGPTLTLGLGGILTELLGDVSHALLPVDASRARQMLERLKGFRLLTGFRGRPPCDVDALCAAVAALSDAALACGDALKEVEINPFIVRPAGQGVVAVDCLVGLLLPGDPQRNQEEPHGNADTSGRNVA